MSFNGIFSIHPKYLIAFVLIALVTPLFGAQYVLTVADFKVQTTDEKYLYVGKGISALLANELRQSKAVDLVEREKLNEIITEQKLSLTGITQGDVTIGQLLDVDLFVVGEIIDMGSTFLIDVRVIDVVTGEIFWSGSITEKLRRYDYIGAYFADAILSELEIDTVEETITKFEEKEGKDENALIAMSEGIEAYDQGDEKTAKEQLSEARRIDPENEVAKLYLTKIYQLTPRGKIELSAYMPPYTASSLGFIESISIYTWIGLPYNRVFSSNEDGTQSIEGTPYVGSEDNRTYTVGVSIPIGKRFGIDFGIKTGENSFMISNSTDPNWANFESTTSSTFKTHYQNSTGYISSGYAINQKASIGLAAMIFYTRNHQTGVSDAIDGYGNLVHEGLFFSMVPSFTVNLKSKRTLLDFSLAYTNQEVYQIKDDGIISLGYAPMVFDASLIMGPYWQSLFVGARINSDIYYNYIVGHNLRIVPTIEYWPIKVLTLRAGLEYSHSIYEGNYTPGYGGYFGLSINPWKFKIHTNISYRYRPMSAMPDSLMKDLRFLFGIEFDSDWLSR